VPQAGAHVDSTVSTSARWHAISRSAGGQR